VFDNSAGNATNPTTPPTRAVWGFRSSDEMGDLWVQLTAASPRDREVLERETDIKMTRETIVGYETQISVNPDYVPIRNDVAVLYMETGRPAAAIPHFARAAALEPASPATHFNLARALQGGGRADAAILEYQEALRLNPSYERARGGLAEAYYLQAFARDERGEFGPAAESLRLALAIRPDWADALSHLAWVLATGDGFDRAAREESVRLGERARDLSASRDANVLDSLAAAYASVGRYQEAIETARAAIARAAAVSPDLVGQMEARLNIYRASQAIVRHPPAK
jgi:tetratricopeptide (TPR) repeat protein